MPDHSMDTGPPTKPTQLPDFRPKGMTVFDKICAWLMAFVIVITLLAFGNRALNEHIKNDNKPAPKATATAPAKPGKTTSKAGNSCPT